MRNRAPMSEAVSSTIAQLEAKLSPIVPVDADFGRALTRLCSDRATFSRGQPVITAGESYRFIYLIENGWAQRSKQLPGGARQIVNFAIPADFLCFNAALFAVSDHEIRAKTELVCFTLPIEPFLKILRDKPQVALALAWANAQEEAMLAERVASLGRRSARERLSHMFCELWIRLARLGMAGPGGFMLPVTQEDLADALGLSLVHVNRTLRELRREGLVTFRHGRLELSDWPGLQRAAGFDASYLHASHLAELQSR
jgi:CRP-like cAMP-binding protein